MIKRQPPMIGFGTGRCGTKSLAAILNACNGARVLHERWVPNWYNPNHTKSNRVLRFLDRRAESGRLAGVVSFALLPRVEEYRTIIPDLKLVCLHRSKEETVGSFLRWCEGVSRTKPHSYSGKRSKELNGHFKKFPIIDAYDTRQAWEFYWEYYEKWARSIEGVYHIDMYDLNDKNKVARLFDYLEIPKDDRKYIGSTHRHKGSEQ